jgi:hypothetical protein
VSDDDVNEDMGSAPVQDHRDTGIGAPSIMHKAHLGDGKNNLGLRDSEDEKPVQASPSPGAWVKV